MSILFEGKWLIYPNDCVYCLLFDIIQVYNVFHDNETNKENVQSYMLHLKEHLNSRPVNRQCSRCALTFLNEGHKRVHAKFYHQTFNKKVKAMTAPTTTMIKPKVSLASFKFS